MKSPKMEKAISRVENGNAAVATQNPAEIAMITPFDPQSFGERLVAEDLECAPQLITLGEGQQLVGYVLEGNGPLAEFTDRDTGIVKEVQTWILATPDGRMRGSLLSSAQLDRKLPPFVGEIVTIARGPDKNTGNGHRVTEYLVAGPRRKDGTRRDWSQAPKQLPAGPVVNDEQVS